MGNTVQPKSVWEIIVGICSVVMFIFVPVFVDFNLDLFGQQLFFTITSKNNGEIDELEASGNRVVDTLFDVVNIIIGSTLILLQIWK